jgi:hypothetical protein
LTTLGPRTIVYKLIWAGKVEGPVLAIRASIQKSVFVAGQHPAVPTAERAAVRTWGYLSGLVMVAGVVYAFWGGWYWAAIGIVVGFVIANANRKSAADVVARTAQANPAFKEEMIRSGIIIDQ